MLYPCVEMSASLLYNGSQGLFAFKGLEVVL